MNFKRPVMNKKIMIYIAITTALIVAVPTTVYSYNSYNYKKHYEEGSLLLLKDDFSNAKETFNKAISYDNKRVNEIEEKLKLIAIIETSKTEYEKASSLMEERKYLEAIDSFKKVSEDDAARYQSSLDKIKECSELYIKENIDKAKEEASNKKFAEAIVFLDTVTTFPPSNEEAKSLKDQYTKEFEKIKEEERLEKERLKEEERKKAEEAAEEAKRKAQQTVTTQTAQAKPKTNTPAAPSNSDDNFSLKVVRREPVAPYRPSSQVRGEAAIKAEFEKMGFVFETDKAAIYSKDGIEIGLLNRGDMWQIITRTWSYEEREIFTDCMTVIWGQETAWSNLLYINYALEIPNSTHESGNIRAFAQDGKLIVHVFLPKK